MSYIRHKTRQGKKYAYEVTSYWDPEMKRSRQKTVYLGAVSDTGSIIPVGQNKDVRESMILDFGEGFCLHRFLEQTPLHQTLHATLTQKELNEIVPLIFYRISMASAMQNCERWREGTVLQHFYPDADLSSQNISRVLAKLGSEILQRNFFQHHLAASGGTKKSVIIDATALPNQIQTGFSAWGYSDGGIEKQFRLLCVLDTETKRPLFYRYLPGNLADVSTLQHTIAELDKMGVQNSFALMDAGYFSETNILALYESKIEFLTRLPAGRALYKNLLLAEVHDLERPHNAAKYGSRGLFAKAVEIDLFGQKGFAYLVLDPARKGKEMNALLLQAAEEAKGNAPEIDPLDFNKCGVMVLVSSKKIETSEVVACYYMRQSVEQVFGFCKDDLNLLPIRRHNEATIRGYLFLQFLTLILFIELREKLLDLCTVEQGLMTLRNLKCKVFDKELLVSEVTKKQKELFDQLEIIAPMRLGI